MKTLSIDIETYSSAPLQKSGVYRYVEAEDFEILLFGYSVDFGPVQVVDLACGEHIPQKILLALEDDTVLKWAFNASFERICLSRFLGYPTGDYLNPESWRCSMIWAATMGLPLSLEGVGAVLGLEKQKLTEGKDLIKYFCQPCAPTKSNGQRTRNRPDVVQELVWHTQAVFQRYLTAHNLCFEYTVVPRSVDNKISICIYYCEYTTEYAQYKATCREAIYLSIEQTCPPLSEQLSTKENGIVLGYSFSKWQKSGQVVPILWDLQKAPHAIVGGPSGSGKSVYTLWLTEQMLSQGFDVCICDYKGFGDYRSFRGSYATGADCDELLRRFCDRFDSARKTGSTDGKPVAMIFDEFTAFAMSKSKREHEELMQLLSGVFLMGRSYNFHLILVSQRFDADALKTAYREQCGVKVHMGASISQQSATMLFPNSEIDKSSRLQEFCGYLSTPQQDLEIIITPKFDLTALHKRISRLSRGLR